MWARQTFEIWHLRPLHPNPNSPFPVSPAGGLAEARPSPLRTRSGQARLRLHDAAVPGQLVPAGRAQQPAQVPFLPYSAQHGPRKEVLRLDPSAAAAAAGRGRLSLPEGGGERGVGAADPEALRLWHELYKALQASQTTEQDALTNSCWRGRGGPTGEGGRIHTPHTHDRKKMGLNLHSSITVSIFAIKHRLICGVTSSVTL